MIDYKDALAMIQQEGKDRLLSAETVPLGQISGRICAEEVRAPIANQPFDNSAMDGFAIRTEDLLGVTDEKSLALDVIARVAAGDAPPSKLPSRGQCYEIMTGAPLPPGCDAVVPVEHTERSAGGKVLFRSLPSRGENIRRAGEDVAIGEVVLRRGDATDVQHILALATLGISALSVVRKPKVAFLSTGREIVDDFSVPLGPGQIYNSSGPYLRAALPAFGADVTTYGTITDEPDAFAKMLDRIIGDAPDIIVTTGAVSAGVYDFIGDVIKKAGASVLFHKVKIRPGKPLLFAKLPGGGPLFVGLPGNPVASAAGLRFFIYPLIRAMQGLEPETPRYALLGNSYTKKSGFRFFLRSSVRYSGKAILEAEILSKQQSFMVSGFLAANSWVVAPEDTEQLKAGDLVATYPLQPFQFEG